MVVDTSKATHSVFVEQISPGQTECQIVYQSDDGEYHTIPSGYLDAKLSEIGVSLYDNPNYADCKISITETANYFTNNVPQYENIFWGHEIILASKSDLLREIFAQLPCD